MKVEHFCRIPDSVLLDQELTPAARCVFAYMAGRAHVGTVSTTGIRKIAKSLGFSRSTVEAALKQLIVQKHVTRAATGKQRSSYNLTSEIFGAVYREGRRMLTKGESGGVMLACEGDTGLVSRPRKTA